MSLLNADVRTVEKDNEFERNLQCDSFDSHPPLLSGSVDRNANFVGEWFPRGQQLVKCFATHDITQRCLGYEQRRLVHIWDLNCRMQWASDIVEEHCVDANGDRVPGDHFLRGNDLHSGAQVHKGVGVDARQIPDQTWPCCALPKRERVRQDNTSGLTVLPDAPEAEENGSLELGDCSIAKKYAQWEGEDNDEPGQKYCDFLKGGIFPVLIYRGISQPVNKGEYLSTLKWNNYLFEYISFRFCVAPLTLRYLSRNRLSYRP